MGKKIDARTVKTLQNIRKSFLELLEENKFDKITVKMICDMSHINKMTFYKYYADKYDLLAKITKHVVGYEFGKVYGSNEEFLKLSLVDGISRSLVLLNDVANKYEKQLNNLKSPSLYLGFDVFKDALYQSFANFLNSVKQCIPLTYPVDFVAPFLFNGYVAAYDVYRKKYLHTTNKDEIKEEYIKILLRLSENIAKVIENNNLK